MCVCSLYVSLGVIGIVALVEHIICQSALTAYQKNLSFSVLIRVEKRNMHVKGYTKPNHGTFMVLKTGLQ